MIWKAFLALVGVLVFAVGVCTFTSIFFHWPLDSTKWSGPPRPPDQHVPHYSVVQHCMSLPNGEVVCSQTEIESRRPEDCTVKSQGSEPRRVVTLNESFSLNLMVSLGSGKQCEDSVVISAPAFDVKPDAQTFKLPDSQGRNSQPFTFLLIPKQPGNQLLSINSHAGQDLLYYSVKPSEFVPSWLTPFIAPLLSLLGPILTVPWWIDRRDQKKKEEEEAKNKAEEETKKKAEEDAKNKSVIISP